MVVAGGVQNMTMIPISSAMTLAGSLGFDSPFNTSQGWLARYGDQEVSQFRSAEMIAEHWDISRMAVVDRNVLRLAVYEMLKRRDVPMKVVINEAIELGKKYSTEHSGAFINGILDRIRGQIEGQRVAEGKG